EGIFLPAYADYTFNVVHSLSGLEGSGCDAELYLRSDGILIGTTTGGGANNSGTIFSLAPGKNGYTFNTLHDFTGTDGSLAGGFLTLGDGGTLLGTCYCGGQFGGGVVYSLTPSGSGYTFGIIYYGFNASNGYQPNPLTVGANGILYGTNNAGGANGK